MKRFVLMAGIVTATTGLTAVTALAQGPGHGRHGERMTFQELDIDGDGQITLIEMQQRGTNRFNSVDTNGDGQLSQEEMVAGAIKRAEERVLLMMTEFDKNGDGVLTQDEMPKPRRSAWMFERIDLDGSGSISEEEFTDAREQMKGRHKKGHGKWHKKSETNKN